VYRLRTLNQYQYRIKELCIKLVIEASLYSDARSEKYQITFYIILTLWWKQKVLSPDIMNLPANVTLIATACQT
jgi:hypothetical protein